MIMITNSVAMFFVIGHAKYLEKGFDAKSWFHTFEKRKNNFL